jgi:hypothetical protein
MGGSAGQAIARAAALSVPHYQMQPRKLRLLIDPLFAIKSTAQFFERLGGNVRRLPSALGDGLRCSRCRHGSPMSGFRP